MKHEISVLGCGVIYIDNERVFGSKPYGFFSTVNWSATDEDLKRIADRCLELIADRKDEPIQIIIPKNHGRKQAFAMIDEIYAMADRKTEPQTCEECEHWSDTEDGCADRHGCKTENSSEIPNNSKERSSEWQ